MSRIKPMVMMGLVVAVLLTACGTNPVKDVYTAAGDINDPAALKRTSVFRADDDLNVVVTLNSHNRDLPVHAVFYAPDNAAQYATDVIEVGQTAGKVLLGLDWEMAGSTPWPVGQWKVEIFIDGERKDSTTFEVQAPEAAPAG